jgi:hypothetical protein
MSRVFSTSEASDILASALDEDKEKEKALPPVEPPAEKPTWLEARFGEVEHQQDEKRRISTAFIGLSHLITCL